MTSPGTVFSSANLDALLGHLPADSLSAEIVAALRTATTDAEARAALQAITQARIDEERARLSAETASA